MPESALHRCIVCPSKGPDDPGHDPDYDHNYPSRRSTDGTD